MIGLYEKWQELHLEQYSRVFAVLKSLQNLQAPTKRRSSFLQRDNLYESQIIDESNIPTWMQDC